MQGFKKRYQEANIFFSEKFRSKRKVESVRDYEYLCTLTDQCQKLYEEIKKRSVECIQPRGNPLRVLTPRESGGLSAYPEQKLADSFASYSNALNDSQPLGKVLDDSAEAFHRLAAGRCQAVNDMKGTIVATLRDTLNEDFKTLGHMRATVEKCRRTLEYAHRKVEKGTISDTHPEYLIAKENYENKLSETESDLMNFHEGENEQVQLLGHLVDVNLTYHKEALEVLTQLQTSIRRVSENLQQQARDHSRGVNSAADSLCDSNFPDSGKATPMCRALYDFEAKSDAELNLKEGDIVQLLDKVDDCWFHGSLKGVTGHFPINYVEVLVPLP